MNDKVLVTGGAGYIGSVLIPLLLDQKFKVTVYDLLLYGGMSLLPYVSNPGFSFIKGDIRDKPALTPVTKENDLIIHLAAVVGGIGANRENPGNFFYDNAIMGIQLMHEAYLRKIEKFAVLGTICCYPKNTPVPFKEENLWNGYPEETNAPYGLVIK